APKENYFSKLGIDDEIVDIFKEEVSTYFKLIGAALSTLRNNMTHRQSMRDIEKAAHSLRSSAKMLGFQKISNLVKPMETVAEKMNEGELRVTSELIDLYETSIERLKQLTAGTDVDVDDVVGKLQSYEQKAPEATDIKPVNDEDVRARIKAELTQEIKLDKVPEKAVTPNEKVISEKKTETKVKAVKKPAKAFDDVPIEKDAILKNLLKSGPQLLDEMFEATQHGV
ncbi:MAG TPA: Hpt domain-containing protein, partial [bacterium]|nr:Hpt domain-containing protein [bacterium]